MRDQKQTKQKNQILDTRLTKKFKQLGFEELTEIQNRAVPIVDQKKDCLIIAPTGSGKTECSVIPIFSKIKQKKNNKKIKVLYVTPLRALNRDVFRRITRYAHNEDLSIEIRHGDTSQSMRRKITANPPDILITTPETLLILLTQQKVLTALSELEWVVIDEVHELLSSERGSQLSLSLERLQYNSRLDITRIGLSATIGNYEDAAKFVVGTRRNYKIIRDSSLRKYDVEVRYVKGTIKDVADNIVEYVKILKISTPILLFTNTRGESELLASILRDLSSIPVELHHGSLSKHVREETETILREGKKGIVVCTSSLELGLDIGTVELVIHYGSPRQVSKLMQRIGRSRHKRGSSAKGLVITNNPDDEFEANAILERIKEGSIEDQKIHEGSLDVLAHHLVGMTMQIGEVSLELAYKLITQSFPFRMLRFDQLIDVIELLDSNYLLYFDKEKMLFWKKGRTFRYYFENLSTIPDILKFRVFDSVGKHVIGSLDQRFVGDFGESGNIFVLKGMQWKILNVDEKSFIVNVEPMKVNATTIPYWEGENIPVDYRTAAKVGMFRSKVKHDSFKTINQVISNLEFDIIPDDKTIVVESVKGESAIVLHSCFGTKINATLSTLLSSMLSSLLGLTVDSRSDAYRIVLNTRSRMSQEIIQKVLYDDYDLYTLVSASLSGTHNLNWRTWCVAKKFGVVERGAVYDRRTARFLYERYLDTALGREATRELFHDKYDIKGTESLLRKIRDKKVIIKWFDLNQFSKLAEPILDHTSKYYSSPANLDKGIIELIKNRILKTKHRMVCARCGKWERVYETQEISKQLVCPHCKARQITTTFYSDYDLGKIIQKKRKGEKIEKDEEHRYKRAWKASSLIENFGKTAITVLSGYGIGPETAGRILRNMVDEEDLYRQIYEAERQFVMTRGFWDS